MLRAFRVCRFYRVRVYRVFRIAKVFSEFRV